MTTARTRQSQGRHHICKGVRRDAERGVCHLALPQPHNPKVATRKPRSISHRTMLPIYAADPLRSLALGLTSAERQFCAREGA